MRIQMRLSRDTVLAMQQYKIIMFNDPYARVTLGYLVGMAYKEIENKINTIDWKTLNTSNIIGVTGNNDENITGLQTALNLEQSVIYGIERLRKCFIDVFNTKRIYKPFVIKLILFAAISEKTKT